MRSIIHRQSVVHGGGKWLGVQPYPLPNVTVHC